MQRCIVILAVGVLAFAIPADSTIINVPDDYPTIQQGIDASFDGDTVLVADGHYYERLNFYGRGILVSSEFLLDQDTMHIQNTIIDADTLIIGVVDTASVVCFVGGEDSSSIIQGFTIQNGIGTTIESFYYRYGGGIFCSNGSNPRIENNHIINNSVHSHGGGIWCSNASPSIIGNTIRGNLAGGYRNGGGGGICCVNSGASISNNIIDGNTCYRENIGYGGIPAGGGIFCTGIPSPTIVDNVISNNWAQGSAGGIICLSSDPIIDLNIIYANEAHFFGGGGILCSQSDATITRNTIEENLAHGNYGYGLPGKGGGIMAWNPASPGIIINDNTIAGNWAAHFGGGIYSERSDTEISDNLITGNSSPGPGGGVCFSQHSDANSITINSNVIANNSTDSYGAGIYLSDSSPSIINNTLNGNIAELGGGGLFCALVSNPVITSTIFWGNSAQYGAEIDLDDSSSPTITYCDIQGGWAGEGNIDCDPLFCFPDTGNFFINYSSCCVGAGEGGVDIGAFGVGCGQEIPTLSEWGMIILGLLVLAAGTVAIVRRRQAVSEGQT